MKNKKNLFLTIILCFPLLFTSCLFTLLSERKLGINRAEYEDDTHFYLYFSGTESECGLPSKDSLFISNRFDSNAERTHRIVKIEQNWWDILLGGYVYRCEVSPEFQQGESVYIWIDARDYYGEILGTAEFVVP